MLIENRNDNAETGCSIRENSSYTILLNACNKRKEDVSGLTTKKEEKKVGAKNYKDEF